MNFPTQEFMFGRQRVRQWVSLITQQYRLRHVYQIMGLNLGTDDTGSFYYTLHLTTMSAPFYTSEEMNNPNPKWSELNLKEMSNLSASCVVLRIWQHSNDGADKILVTWGVNFSGLCYIGNKISDIQPYFFKNNSVIFYMQGGFYTSHEVIRTDLHKPVPFVNNLLETTGSKVMYKRLAVKSYSHEIQQSYNIDKLRQLQQLQMQIRNRQTDVQYIKDKINMVNGYNASLEKDVSPSSGSMGNIRYAPQLLTMNSLNKLLYEKPTYVQKQEMAKNTKEIEKIKFKTKLLSQEKAKKTVIIRTLKQNYAAILEKNEERNSDLMENYHKLSRGSEKLKEYKKNILHHKEIYSNIHSQLQQRRRQLLRELLFIFPIENICDDKYTIIGIHLPNSDVLADCSDSGLSVALGYIAHVLIMCSTFLQVPVRYSLTHYGSRSYIADNVSPMLLDKDRLFPLFTRGKEKVQFTYAVYLLNKNLAQFRWLFYMNTTDLRATLHNLLTFLQNPRELRTDASSCASTKPNLNIHKPVIPIEKTERFVSLRSFSSISNVSDPLLDCIRQENRLEISNNPNSRLERNPNVKKCTHGECGKGLSEILAVPEAYMNRQISSDSFRNFVAVKSKDKQEPNTCCESSPDNSLSNFIKITNGKEIPIEKLPDPKKQSLIEQGHDPLANTSSSLPIMRSTNLFSAHLREKSDHYNKYENHRISRSVGSYSEEDHKLVLRSEFELGSEPLLNQEHTENKEDQKVFLNKWLATAPSFVCSSEETLSEPHGGAIFDKSPLMARTNALRTTTSFNLVRPK
ncbi:UV radiation resistance-associated gene protein [Diabrotica undecimpunctata]|uniref:UV radiation resistance-associated gene protein n=1 Tax=Diabrotica undecimpunctata TaxID=50387 RepID=UPI003B6398EB